MVKRNNSYRSLVVWQKGMELAEKVYSITKKFPKEEIYGLTNQIRRASASVPANVVEGYSRNSTKEYIKFLFNARGSLEEVRHFLHLAKDLQYLPEGEYQFLEDGYKQVSKMLNGMLTTLRKKI